MYEMILVKCSTNLTIILKDHCKVIHKIKQYADYHNKMVYCNKLCNSYDNKFINIWNDYSEVI